MNKTPTHTAYCEVTSPPLRKTGRMQECLMDKGKYQPTRKDRRLATTIINLKGADNKRIINTLIDDLLSQIDDLLSQQEEIKAKPLE